MCNLRAFVAQVHSLAENSDDDCGVQLDLSNSSSGSGGKAEAVISDQSSTPKEDAKEILLGIRFDTFPIVVEESEICP